MYKLIVIPILILSSLFQTSCGSAGNQDKEEKMTLSQPAFINAAAYYNTFVAGVEGGGTGIEFYIDIEVLPADVVLENVFFRESVGKLLPSNGNFVARFRTDSEKDVIMSSNPEEEAVNTPPERKEKFPFPLSEDEAGITYRDNGILKYTKIQNIKETDGIAYPSAPPSDKG